MFEMLSLIIYHNSQPFIAYPVLCLEIPIDGNSTMFLPKAYRVIKLMATVVFCSHQIQTLLIEGKL